MVLPEKTARRVCLPLGRRTDPWPSVICTVRKSTHTPPRLRCSFAVPSASSGRTVTVSLEVPESVTRALTLTGAAALPGSEPSAAPTRAINRAFFLSAGTTAEKTAAPSWAFACTVSTRTAVDASAS